MFKNQFNCLTPPQKIFLPDGTELRLCKNAVPRKGCAKLYCSRMGVFFSLSSRGLNQIRCYHVKNFKAKPNVHSYYPRMCGFIGNPYCHLLIAAAWIGPRRCNQECHHLNGINTDNRASNLIWLSREQHRRFDAALRQGLVLTQHDAEAIMNEEITCHVEFLEH